MTPHKAYLPHYIAILALAAAGELFLPLLPGLYFIGVFAYFCIVEGVALKRAGPMDTMTEFWGWFQRAERSRRFIVVGFALYAPLRLMSIPQMFDGGAVGFLRWAPTVCFFGGAGAWLLKHLLDARDPMGGPE